MDNQLEYVKQLEQRIAATRTTLEKLKTERQQTLIAARHEEIENLEKYLDQADVNYKGLAGAVGEATDELKEAMEQLMNNIAESLKRLLGNSDDTSG